MARIEAISPTAYLQAKPRWQFSIRSFLLLTGIIALVIAHWPVREQSWQLQAAFAALTSALLVTVCLALPAWRIAQRRWNRQAEQGEVSPVTNERTALGFGLGSMLTYGPLLLVALIAPHPATNPLVQGVRLSVVVFAVALWPLIVFALSLSFVTFWGAVKNPPLFVLLVIGLLANVVLVWAAIEAIAGLD